MGKIPPDGFLMIEPETVSIVVGRPLTTGPQTPIRFRTPVMLDQVPINARANAGARRHVGKALFAEGSGQPR